MRPRDIWQPTMLALAVIAGVDLVDRHQTAWTIIGAALIAASVACLLLERSRP